MSRTSKIQTALTRISRSRAVRAFCHRAPLAAARRLTALGAPKASLGILYCVSKPYPNSKPLLKARLDALERLGRHGEAVKLQTLYLRRALRRAISRRQIAGMLVLMARLERLKQAGLLSAGHIISDRLMRQSGQRSLLKAARKARKDFPDSPFLIHLQSLCQARLGEYRDAHKLLQEQIARIPSARTPDEKRGFDVRRDSWRVVDLAAREQMDWAGEEQGYETLFTQLSEDIAAKEAGTAAGEIVAEQRVFKEHALQGRMRNHYLDVCEQEFHARARIGQKLRAIDEMLRIGSRHIPTYAQSYARARDCLQRIRPELETLYHDEVVSARERMQIVTDLCIWLRLSQRLGHADTAKCIVNHLLHLSENEDWASALVRAPDAIGNDPTQAESAALIMSRVEHVQLTQDWEVRCYFRWAMMAGEYEKAHARFAELTWRQKRFHGALYQSNILQREGRFREASLLARNVHAELLRVPHLVKAYSNYALMKRRGELAFLGRTAKIYGETPQPQDPVGIVLIAPRNIDQLRRYPLVVLRELKRRGWAVIPLVEGLLPRELTGQEEIDVLNGAISPNVRLNPLAEKVLPQLENFAFHPEEGHMSWNGIDLSHALWEDSAINRRVYSVDFGCPELQIYLGNLAKWTSAMLRALEHTRSLHERRARRIATMSLFSHRLPDAAFRFYCDRFGNAEDFYYVQAANGYQNYFTNFSTNVSERLVLRNLTRHPHLRSASFPVPEAFETYYAENRDRADDLLARWEGVTRVRRSTIGRKALPDEARALRTRVDAWRRGGGKVACAFGKVVFDSGVPFDGGAAHANMRDWINHCIETVKDSDTLLLIKPHPHEINNQIATFPNEYFRDLMDAPLNGNVALVGHTWFDIHDMKDIVDLGLIYNGTTAVELGILGIPCLLSGHFSAIDYPIGHVVPQSRAAFERLLRFEDPSVVALDIRRRAAVWLDYMADPGFTQAYRFHARPVTNKVLYPPVWFDGDLAAFMGGDSRAVDTLVARFLGEAGEPGAPRRAAVSIGETAHGSPGPRLALR